MKRLFPLIALLALALPVAGCDSSSGPRKNESEVAAEEAAKAQDPDQYDKVVEQASKPIAIGKKLKVVNSDYGKVVADSKGEALYLFTKEKGKTSECYGECAKAWPPVFSAGQPLAGKGITESKLGTTKRRNGKLQATYNGHPLYYYRDDSPGKILCQDVPEFGGTWYVVKPSGNPVT